MTAGEPPSQSDAQPRDRADRCKRTACSTLGPLALGGGSSRTLDRSDMARLNATRKVQMQWLGKLVSACLMCLVVSAARSQSDSDAPKYQEIFYSSGNLRIQAYLYKPDGDGRFPAVLYNHGTRDGRERTSFPFPHVARMLTRGGYAVLVPERRGYGKSDGKIWWEETGNDQSKVIVRLQAETDDVLAGAEYLRTLPYIDTNRLRLIKPGEP